MSNLDGNIVPDFLPLIYNYLQYSYYKGNIWFVLKVDFLVFYLYNTTAGDMTKAAECVASFLLFLPKDKAMLNNKNYFTEELGLNKDVFNARPEAMAFKHLQDSERYLLDFIDREFANLSKFDEVKIECINFPIKIGLPLFLIRMMEDREYLMMSCEQVSIFSYSLQVSATQLQYCLNAPIRQLLFVGAIFTLLHSHNL